MAESIVIKEPMEQLAERRTSSLWQVVGIGDGLEQTSTLTYHLSSRRRRELHYESNTQEQQNHTEQLEEMLPSSAWQVVEIGDGLEQTPTFPNHLSSRRRRELYHVSNTREQHARATNNSTSTFPYHLSSRRRRTRVPLVCGTNRRSKLHYENKLPHSPITCPPDEGGNSTTRANFHIPPSLVLPTKEDSSPASLRGEQAKQTPLREQTPTFPYHLSSRRRRELYYESNTQEQQNHTEQLVEILPSSVWQVVRMGEGTSLVSMTSSRNRRWIRTNSRILLSLVLPTKEGTLPREQHTGATSGDTSFVSMTSSKNGRGHFLSQHDK
jgi:hypothetical protein